MSPAFVPLIKDLTRQLSQERAREILDDVWKLKTTAQISRHMARQVEELAPNLKLLDME